MEVARAAPAGDGDGSFDAFDTGAARRRVLAAWADSAARFREDANSEEDLVLGGYRDRVVVELAQNAADAATRAGVPGRLLLRLTGEGPHGTLIAANSGAPLDRDGVRALASLRASAKRDGTTAGRFGVGFAAVLAVTDEPAVHSTTGGVRFSAAATRALIAELGPGAGDLGDEVARRAGHVPILRLPFTDPGSPPDGYETAVVLPLRDDAARELVVRLLAGAGDPLLIALPGLSEIVIEQPGQPARSITAVQDRWHVLRRSGRLDPSALTERPIEERSRAGWTVTWAVPREQGDRAGDVAAVVHAPTPSDEPLTLPALLIATFPLDPSRRHVMAGAVTTEMVEHAADAYADLVAERAADGEPAWPLVPAGLPAGALDHALRQAISGRLVGVPMFPAADEPELLLRARDALAMAAPLGADERAVEVLATWMAGLVHAPRAADAAFASLGVRRLELAELVEQLPPTPDPERWRSLYDVLAPYAGDPRGREALAAIGVPLADGRVARGARGLLLGTDGVSASALADLGVKVVHPDAAHPLLERLGATPAGPGAVLGLPAVHGAVLAQGDGDEPGRITEAVLTLVAAAVAAGQLAPGDRPWLSELELDDDEGEPGPAGALALPGSPAAGWFDRDDVGVADPALVSRWGAETLTAIGVLSGPGLWRAHDIALDDGSDEIGDDDPAAPGAVLDGWSDWVEDTLDLVAAQADSRGALIPELSAVRDLDLVRPAALAPVVAAIAADPVLRPVLVSPVRVVAGGITIHVPSHTAWWLRRELTGGAAAGAGAEPGLALILPPAPAWLSGAAPPVQQALGVVSTLDDLDAATLPLVLERLADPALPVSPAFLLRLLHHLAGLAQQGARLALAPEFVRALTGPGATSGTMVVPAGEAVVTDAPMYRQRPELGAPLLVSAERARGLADLLDLPLASELTAGVVDDTGASRQPVDPAAAELIGPVAGTWCEHEELVVDGVEVDWWVDAAGLPHAATLDGLARALASSAGRWPLRHALAQVLLAGPDDQATVLAEAAADEAG